jgi:RsiW-degrading membrane proteinase PrsW (M82 family)
MVIILLALALAPGLAIAFYIFYKDQHEREPTRLLIKSFLYGIGSVIVTLLISYSLEGAGVVDLEANTFWETVIDAFFVVALVEEFSKFIFVRWLLYPNKNFNEPFDGIVYTVMVGMGFATLENITYVMNGGIGVALLRMFTAVPAHAIFAVIMGFFIGEAKFLQRNRTLYLIVGLLAATVVHGFYDLFLFLSFPTGIWAGAFISLFIALLLARKAIKIHQEASPFREDTITP